MGGPVKKGWCHVPIPLTQGSVPLMNRGSTFCVVQERVPKDQWSKRSQIKGHVPVRKLWELHRPITLGMKYEKLVMMTFIVGHLH